jgi:hypothetical protein
VRHRAGHVDRGLRAVHPPKVKIASREESRATDGESHLVSAGKKCSCGRGGEKGKQTHVMQT